MSKRLLVDTNLILRHLVQDDLRQAKIAAKLFTGSDRGDITLVVLAAVFVECVFVLESFYKYDRAVIARVLIALLTSPGVETDDLQIHLDALGRYGQSNMHIVDCLLAATAASEGLSLATFDQGFKKFSDVTIDLG